MSAKKSSLLDRINIPTPCTADWDAMTGNSQVRFCEHCSKHVNNLSEMTRKQALELVSRSKGQLCVRYYRDPNKTIHTKPAPTQLHQIKRRASRLAAGAFTAALSLCSNVAAQTPASQPVTSNITIPLDAAPAQNQGGGKATLAGTVKDPNGAVIPSANVTLINENTKQEQTTTTSDEGDYSFQSVEGGSYTLRINYPGFSTSETLNLALQTNESRHLDTVLEIGGALSGMVALPVLIEEPLVKAASEDDLEKVRELIGMGVDATRRDKNTDTTALDEAIKNSNREMVRALLDVGADVNARNSRHQTALMRIDDDATPELIWDLISAGAKVNAKDEDGDTALIFAAEWSSAEVLKALVQAGARVNAQNHEGVTAFMMAAGDGDLEAVKILYDAGADINHRNKEGATALSQARESQYAEVVEFLKAHNAIDFPTVKPEEK